MFRRLQRRTGPHFSLSASVILAACVVTHSIAQDTNGPRVVAHAPTTLSATAEGLASLTLTFSEPVDTATVARADLGIQNPQGLVITSGTFSAVEGSGDTQLVLALTNQFLRGMYRFVAGPDIRDAAGNLMDQDSDGLNGEAQDDRYAGTVNYNAALWNEPGLAPALYVEDFERWSNRVPEHWWFDAVDGTVADVTNQSARSGIRNLMFRGPSQQKAGFACDLSAISGISSLYLSFAVKRSSTSGVFSAEISGNGLNWDTIYSDDPPTNYTDIPMDLIRQGRYPPQLYLRFTNDTGGDTNQVACLEDVAVVTEMPGLRILEHSPSALAATNTSLAEVLVSFNDEADASSFDATDVVLRSPQGLVTAPAAVEPVAGTTNTRFRLVFTNQSVRGTYRLTVGPNILDTSGSAMNQDGDIPRGEAGQDDYDGTISFEQTVQATPALNEAAYSDGFEAWPPAPSHWSFTTTGSGTVLPVAGATHSGVRHLEFIPNSDTAIGTQSATLAVDLSSMNGWTNLFFKYWVRRDTTTGDFLTQFSGDGQTWHDVLLTTPPSTYTEYVIDLDASAAAAGIALDTNVFIRFRNRNTSTRKADLDDVRITVAPPELVVTSLDMTSNIWMQCSHADGWVPFPVCAAQPDGPWSNVAVYGVDCPAGSGPCDVWFPVPTDETRLFYRVRSQRE